ncbi:helicase-associated domain-containing protein [Paenibacillus sp. HJGM_3]|uniref:helicase-associated domain-containing protein n=1 Tax=Paenibacillus sp. HJGM_3 TaxID=3379816 RepID=UPI00385B4320
MNVNEFVYKLPEPLAEEIRKHLTSASVPGGEEAQPGLEDLLRSKDALARVRAGLRSPEEETLRIVVTAFADEPFEEANLERAGRARLSGAALKVGLLRLCRKGIVFALRKAWGEPLYTLPSDTLGIWQELLFPLRDGKREPLDDAEPVTTVTPELAVPAQRLLSLLAYANREGLPLTQKGTLAKRQLLKLNALLHIDAEEGGMPDVRYAGDGAYPFTLAALLDVSLRLGLLRKEADLYSLNETALAAWLARPEGQLNQEAYALLRPLLMPPEPAFRHWIVLSEAQSPGNWWPIDASIEELERRGLIGSGSLESGGLLTGWLKPLAAIGFVELGRAADGSWRAKWTTPAARTEPHAQAACLGNVNESMFVQPDFEVIVPPGVPYAARWELERFAEQEHAGTIVRYRLTRERVVQALTAGYTGERIVSVLQAHAKYGVPELVDYSIRQWAGQYGKVSVEDAVLLRCRDEAAARELEANRQVEPYLLERLGPLAWLADARRADELFRQLEASGYSPSRVNLARGAETEKAEDGPRPAAVAGGSARKQTLANRAEALKAPDGGAGAPEGLIYSRLSVQYYDIERTFPRTEDLYPGLQEVPNMWLKECRRYHAATRMDMIRKALQWKACLRLRQQGEDRLLVPERLEGNPEEWRVAGFQSNGEVRLSPEQWDEMQLVLPGINDE